MDENNTSIAGRLTVRNKKTKKEEKMVIMPLDMLTNMMTGLDRAEFRVLIYILSKAQYGKDPLVTLPSQRLISELLDMAPSSVTKAMKVLQYKGFIKVSKEGENNKYILSCPEIEKEVDDDFTIVLK